MFVFFLDSEEHILISKIYQFMHVENFNEIFIYPYETLEFMQIKVYGT